MSRIARRGAAPGEKQGFVDVVSGGGRIGAKLMYLLTLAGTAATSISALANGVAHRQRNKRFHQASLWMIQAALGDQLANANMRGCGVKVSSNITVHKFCRPGAYKRSPTQELINAVGV